MKTQPLKIVGLSLFLLGLAIFSISLFLSEHRLTAAHFEHRLSPNGDSIYFINNPHHRQAVAYQAQQQNVINQQFSSNVSFVWAMQSVMLAAEKQLADNWAAGKAPAGVGEWDYKLTAYWQGAYLLPLVQVTASGTLPQHAVLFFWLSIALASLGALISFIPNALQSSSGIQHNGIFHRATTRGVRWSIRAFLLLLVVVFALIYAVGQSPLLLIALLLVLGAILFFIWRTETKKHQTPARSASPEQGNAWIGIATGIYLIAFYVLLYWYPYYITNWITMVDPISRFLSGNPANQWFLYGFLYCVVMLVMGVRMFIKYRHNRYQLLRTGSVLFFQLAFAFLLPEILQRLHQPYMDLKLAWPLDKDFFSADAINQKIGQGSSLGFATVGTIMFIWGIAFSLVIVPLFTYLYGKRWYCSWVCGCGGLAETIGDPFRQLSDKSLRAWRIERYLIHGVMVAVVLMTIGVLLHYLTGSSTILFLDAYQMKTWYGFIIGSVFSGVVGTGFYPFMGNRVWCRFGCPLAGLMGIVQRFRSRFRITTNGGQCISCGNCSTYCEMGIDVRAYAQRGQDIVRASCVGCGVCSAVCPRGVLRLENIADDVNTRASEQRVLLINRNGVSMGD